MKNKNQPPSPIPRTGSTPVTAHEQAAQHARFLAAATAENTRRTYRSSVRHFVAWGGPLPADETAVVRYLLAHAETLNPRTLSLRLTALSQWHKVQGFPDPASTPTVRKTLKGITRVHGRPKKKAKALPLEDLERIVAHLAALDTLAAKRDNALLQLGYFGAYRRDELVQLTVLNVAFEREGLRITLGRSKTDQEGHGIDKSIPYGDDILCPTTTLKCWLEAAGIADGPLFRPITRWGRLGETALTAGSVNTILAARAHEAGLSYVPELSSHSLRRGLATSAYRAGADLREIKRQGGWRHDGTVQGYIEEAGAFDENAAGALLRRRRE